LNIVDWDLCRTFMAVAESGSYLAAARRLRSSHPTVSREVAALEAQLGTKLFVRSNEGLALTAQGRRFREHTAAMEAAALRAEAAVSAKGNKARGLVKFSIGPTLAAYWLMPHMASFIETHPDVQIEFVTHPFPVSVRKREADIVLRIYQSGDENLVGRKIARLGVGFMLHEAMQPGIRCLRIATTGSITTSSALQTALQTPNSDAGATMCAPGLRCHALLVAGRYAGRRTSRYRHLRDVLHRGRRA
jgi:DNA-binding transcriptional LysR family regulator